jgi:aspartyl-tRNA(Asn)/glutamyl-tRNA(Gln) amidotransferase subunit A
VLAEPEVAYRPAFQLAADVAAGQVSPVEVLEALLARIERLNPRLNAYCTLAADQAMAEARQAEAAVQRGDRLGPLHGVPVSIKDLIATRGIRTTRGSRLWENWVPEQDAPVVERVRAAGAIVVGKTNTPEIGWKGATDNPVFGPTRNPWDETRTPGGSTGGGSAQVAAGLGPIAIGTDGGGSLRIPAAFAGCYGLKPSFGRVPMYPPSPNSSVAHCGPLTDSVRDAALTLSVLAGPDDRDRHSLPASQTDYLAAVSPRAIEQSLRGLKLAWCADFGWDYWPVDPEVLQATQTAAERFTELGCEVEEVRPEWLGPMEAWNTIFYGGIVGQVSPVLEAKRDLLDPGLVRIVDTYQADSLRAYVEADMARSALWDQVRFFFGQYALLLTPTMPVAAFPLPQDTPGVVPGRLPNGLGWSFFTYPFNLTGQPAASLPCGFTSDGLPIGLQVVGRRHADALVLTASAAFESIAPWQGQRPPQVSG